MKNIQTAYEILAEARRSKNILGIDKRDYTYIKAHMYSIFECYAHGLLSWGQVEDKWYKSVNAYTDLFKENADLYNQQRAFMLDEYRRIMTEYRQPLDEYKSVHEKKMVSNLVIKTHLSEHAAITASKKYYNRVLSEKQLKHIAKMSSWKKVMEFYPNLTNEDEVRVRLLSLFEKPTMNTTKIINMMTEEPVRSVPRTPARKKVDYSLDEAFDIIERKLSSKEKQKKEREVKKLKSHKKEFTDQYGKDKGEDVMYAVATNRAKTKKVKESKKKKGVDGKACWKGYRQSGTKMKGGKKVDNCVKVKETTTAGGIAASAAPMGKVIKRKQTENDCGSKKKKKVQITNHMGTIQKESRRVSEQDTEGLRNIIYEPRETPKRKAFAHRMLDRRERRAERNKEEDRIRQFRRGVDELSTIYGVSQDDVPTTMKQYEQPARIEPELDSKMSKLRDILNDPNTDDRTRNLASREYGILRKRSKMDVDTAQTERDIARSAYADALIGRSNREIQRANAAMSRRSKPTDQGLPEVPDMDWGLKFEETYHGNEFFEAYGVMSYDETILNEAEYQGRKVKLNKPMRGDVKKFKVYVKNQKGNVVKVNFGDPDMKIKKSNPKRRKSFRARHNCDNPGPKWKARYWSCRKW